MSPLLFEWRRRQRWRTPLRAALLVALASLALGGCAGDVDDDDGPVNIDEIPVERRGEMPVRKAYIDGKRAEYYNFGAFVPGDSGWFPTYEDKFPGMPVGLLYVFDDGSGKATLGSAQHPIIDRLPKQSRYSDFLEVILVKPPSGYSANDVKSRGTLLRLEYDLTFTGVVVNCPVVGPDFSLAKPTAQSTGAYQKVTLWYRKQTVHCMLLDGGAELGVKNGAKLTNVSKTPIGEDRDDARVELRVGTGEFFTMRTNAFGGEDRVSAIPVPDNAIFRYKPDSPLYSPLSQIFDVTVPSDYTVGRINSHASLFPLGPDFEDPRIEKRDPEAFCNCPVVWIEK